VTNAKRILRIRRWARQDCQLAQGLTAWRVGREWPSIAAQARMHIRLARARRLFAAELEWLCKRADYADEVDAAAVREAVLRDRLSDTRTDAGRSGMI